MGMMTDRESLVALVWRRMPASLKVTASGTKFVSVNGKLVALESLSDGELFAVLRRCAAVKSLLNSLASEAA